jgi:hypothetical protein
MVSTSTFLDRGLDWARGQGGTDEVVDIDIRPADMLPALSIRLLARKSENWSVTHGSLVQSRAHQVLVQRHTRYLQEQAQKMIGTGRRVAREIRRPVNNCRIRDRRGASKRISSHAA